VNGEHTSGSQALKSILSKGISLGGLGGDLTLLARKAIFGEVSGILFVVATDGVLAVGHFSGCEADLIAGLRVFFEKFSAVRLFFHFVALVFEALLPFLALLRFDPKLGFTLFVSEL